MARKPEDKTPLKLLQDQENELASCPLGIWHEGCNIPSVTTSFQNEGDKLKWQIQLGSTARSPKEDVMKRNLIGILPLLVISMALNVTAHAQALAKANVPFAFRVGSATLPAGTYEISSAGSAAVSVRNKNVTAAAMSTVRHESAQKTEDKLIFHRIGGEYFLAEIWTSAGSPGMVIPRSKQETKLEKELLASGQPNTGEEVLIATY
jgi:hypothetical protein